VVLSEKPTRNQQSALEKAARRISSWPRRISLLPTWDDAVREIKPARSRPRSRSGAVRSQRWAGFGSGGMLARRSFQVGDSNPQRTAVRRFAPSSKHDDSARDSKFPQVFKQGLPEHLWRMAIVEETIGADHGTGQRGDHVERLAVELRTSRFQDRRNRAGSRRAATAVEGNCVRALERASRSPGTGQCCGRWLCGQFRTCGFAWCVSRAERRQVQFGPSVEP